MIKSLVLAAVAATGFGMAAQAAVVDAPFGTFNVMFKMTDAHVYCYFGCPDGALSPRPLAGLEIGDTAKGILTIKDTGRPGDVLVNAKWSGGIIANDWNLTDIGGGRFWTSLGNQLTVNRAGGLVFGELFQTWFSSTRGGFEDVEDVYTIEFAEIAPVPLPASAALLPLGIGALAMMRKRRKQAS